MIQSKREDLAEIEDIGAQMEEALILDNRYIICGVLWKMGTS